MSAPAETVERFASLDALYNFPSGTRLDAANFTQVREKAGAKGLITLVDVDAILERVAARDLGGFSPVMFSCLGMGPIGHGAIFFSGPGARFAAGSVLGSAVRVPRLARDAGAGQSAVLTARPAGRSPPTIVSAHVGGNT